MLSCLDEHLDLLHQLVKFFVCFELDAKRVDHLIMILQHELLDLLVVLDQPVVELSSLL